MMVEWHKFDYDNRRLTAPPADTLVWVNDEYYDGVTLGVFDGFTFRVVPSGSDDCSITHWAELERPHAPTNEEKK